MEALFFLPFLLVGDFSLGLLDFGPEVLEAVFLNRK
jgi:hypothetical protein